MHAANSRGPAALQGEIVTRRFLIERDASGGVTRVCVETSPQRGRKRWQPIWTEKQSFREGDRRFYGGKSLFDVLQVKWFDPPLDVDSIEVPTLALLG